MSLLSYPPNSFYLLVKQQPREALVVAKGKEKARKAIDPPPIVQLDVKSHQDPQKNFLQNPYLFVQVSLYKPDRDEPLPGRESLIGTLTSSLHRLKDQNNVEVGLFVFGDISIRVLGSYRLHFRMYELSPTDFQAQYLASCTSEKFSVLAPKDFKGMEESTSLSRCIADQGVRLRLRKEARTAAGSKRSYPYDSPVSIAQAHASLPNEYSSSYEGEHSPVKRENTYNTNTPTEVSNHSIMEQSYGAPPPYKRSFPSYPSVGHSPPIAPPYSMMSHSSIVGHTPPRSSAPLGFCHRTRVQGTMLIIRAYTVAPHTQARLPLIRGPPLNTQVPDTATCSFPTIATFHVRCVNGLTLLSLAVGQTARFCNEVPSDVHLLIL